MPSDESPARAVETATPEAPHPPAATGATWRQRANTELERMVRLFSSKELPDFCAKALINAPERPSSKWSFGNQLLMLLAGTSDARGYRQWLGVGRHVRAGSKAFYILGPVKVTETSEDEPGKERHEILVGFRGIPVFRLEDTEGQDLPAYTPRDPPPLLEVATRFGMRVVYESLSPLVLGAADYDSKTITLATEDWSVFFHELAHTIHRTFEPKSGHGQEPEAETIAQLVAATLARLYGRPADGFSWTYIAQQAQSSSPQQVGRLCMRVLDRAKRVLELVYLDRPDLSGEALHAAGSSDVLRYNPHRGEPPSEGQGHGT